MLKNSCRPLVGTAWLAGLAVALISTSFAEPARPALDPLDLPAEISARAAKYVLLAVTRAEQRLVAVGEQGIILLSDNNGASWRQAKVPTSVTLTNIRFVSAVKGWTVGHGGIVLTTSDAGETWVKQLDGRQAAQRELEAAKAEGERDASAEWRLREAEQLVADGPDKPLLDVHFFDESNGLVVGAYGLILGTSDGGVTWHSLRQRLDNPDGKHLYSIHATGTEVYIAGEQGALYRSADAARTFTAVQTPYAGTYFGAVTASSGELVVFGLRGNAYRSADRGATWQKIDLTLPVTLTAGARLSDGSLVLVDETGQLLRSRDGGRRFQLLPVPQASSFTGIAQAADGGLVLSGARGMTRLNLNSSLAERQQ